MIRGEVITVKLERNPDGYVDCELDVRLQFMNTGSEPIIMMRPVSKEVPWYGGALVAQTREEADSDRYVVTWIAWPSIFGYPSYRALAKRLDQPIPPADLTWILAPQNMREWRTSAFIRFHETRNTYAFPPESGWDEIDKLGSPLWIRLLYETWPFNVEYFRRDLGRRLRARWRKFGLLWVGDWDGYFNLARLSSQPIRLDLKEAKSALPKSK